MYVGSSGSAFEIPDPTESIYYLFQMMDGTQTIDDLYEKIVIRYPEVSREEFFDAIDQIDTLGALENAAFRPDGLLDAYEVERWERNISYLGTLTNMHTNKYQLQYQIKTAKIALLGIGGLGCHILYDLAAMGAQDIRAVDFDRLEISNLNRQILYNEADIGKPKADLAAQRIREFSPRTKLETISMRRSSVDDVLQVIEGRDYVLCVADRPELEAVMHVDLERGRLKT